MREDDIWAYAEKHSSPEPPLLSRLNRETNLTQVYPRMLAGHMQGTLLRMISHMIRPSRILEIGTFTGYSALCLADGLAPRTTGDNEGWGLHTIEVNPEQESIIRKYFSEAGEEERITLHIGDAMQIVPRLGLTWDLVYIDADKPNYLAYYEMIFPAVRPGGIIIADNALWDGKVLLPPGKMDRDVLGISAYNDFVRSDNRVENLLLPFRDGLMIARKL
jgi:predicted O-methyltransferase YrrM